MIKQISVADDGYLFLNRMNQIYMRFRPAQKDAEYGRARVFIWEKKL